MVSGPDAPQIIQNRTQTRFLGNARGGDDVAMHAEIDGCCGVRKSSRQAREVNGSVTVMTAVSAGTPAILTACSNP
jgi:hypothetical protein